MKKIACLFLLQLIFVASYVISQPCLPNGITFNTQEQIDNFQLYYPNCTEIQGDILIEGNDITNLDGLEVITSVWQNL